MALETHSAAMDDKYLRNIVVTFLLANSVPYLDTRAMLCHWGSTGCSRCQSAALHIRCFVTS
jgi:hypothetical protein